MVAWDHKGVRLPGAGFLAACLLALSQCPSLAAPLSWITGHYGVQYGYDSSLWSPVWTKQKLIFRCLADQCGGKDSSWCIAISDEMAKESSSAELLAELEAELPRLMLNAAGRTDIAIKILEEPETHTLGERLVAFSSYIFSKDKWAMHVWIAQAALSAEVTTLLCMSREENYQLAMPHWIALAGAIREP